MASPLHESTVTSDATASGVPTSGGRAQVARQGARLSAVGNEVDAALYEVRRKIHPRAVQGQFASWRVALVVITQLIFYGLPWLRWNGRQAVLFELVQRKFFIFGWVFWP